MAGRDPRATMGLLADSLAPTLLSAIETEGRRTLFTQSGPKTVIDRWSLNRPLSRDERDQALSCLRTISRPLPKGEALDALTALQLAVRPQGRSGVELQKQLELYRDLVLRFPADVARKVLSDLIEGSDFWPTLNEIRAGLQELSTKRQMLLEMFEHADLVVETPAGSG